MSYVTKQILKDGTTGATILKIAYDDSNNHLVLLDSSDALVVDLQGHAAKHITGGGDALANVLATQLKCYSATGRSGTGSEETIAHGLGAVPNLVSVVGEETGGAASNVWADTTNVYVTYTSGKAYRIYAAL